MIAVHEECECCGCEACAGVCPKMAIKMEMDEEGFYYPSVDGELCIECGMCERVCPLLGGANCKGLENKKAYVIQHKDDTVRMRSTSGGAFTLISSYVLELGGAVFGASYGHDFEVSHCMVETYEDLVRLNNSKYVQSRIGDSFQKCKKLLKEGRMVCFSGTPCQIKGLKNYLMHNYDNLVTVDFVCRGVPSPGLFEKYVAYMRHKGNSGISDITFRNKSYGYAGSTMQVQYANGKKDRDSIAAKSFRRAYFTGICSRRSCYDCAFRNTDRYSDFTLFDVWHIGKYEPSWNDDKGTSGIIVHTRRGEEILDAVKCRCRISSVDMENLIGADGIMFYSNPPQHKEREKFCKDIYNMPYDKLIKKYIPMTLREKAAYMVKPLAYRMGILGLLRRIHHVNY